MFVAVGGSSGEQLGVRPGSSWGFSALLKGLTSVVDNSCRNRDSNPQPRVTSPTLYPIGHGCPYSVGKWSPLHFWIDPGAQLTQKNQDVRSETDLSCHLELFTQADETEAEKDTELK